MPILSEEDLERFRTKVCTLASSMRCDFGVERCNYSHNLYWARRCPFYLRDSSILRYIPACCPDVELGPGSAILKNACPRGNNCSFAHSLEEMHYHPLVYKTELCKEYRLGRCKTYYCHMVHGLAEFRVPREFVLPRKRGLQIPTYAHVTMVDNIRSIQSGSSSCGHIKDKNRGRSARDSPKVTPLTLQPNSRIDMPKNRMERLESDPVTNSQMFCREIQEVAENRLGSLRWGNEMPHGNKSKGLPCLFDRFRLDEQSSSGGSKPMCEHIKKPAGNYHSNVKLIDNVEEIALSDAESSTPWYGKGLEINEMPAYNFSSFDTIFQESVKGLGRPSSEAATGDSMSKVNSLVNSEEMIQSGAKVVRNVGGWQNTNQVAPREHSLQSAKDSDKQMDLVAAKDSNAGLMEYIYHTILQQCAVISEKCIQTNDNRGNLELICKEARSLWELIVNIQSLLYDGLPGGAAEGQKADVNGFEGQWSSIGSFYSELLEAYEAENGKTATASATSGELPNTSTAVID